jgi:glucose/arabinose dehydrogenase
MFLLLWISFASHAARVAGEFDSERHNFRVVVVTEGLEHPWGLAFLPDGRMLVTERPGRLRVVKDGVLDPDPVGGLPVVSAYGQGGLLDVALHPDYSNNKLVYLSYAAAGDGGFSTEVARGRLAGHRLEDVEVLFRAQPKVGGGRHFGSRFVFGDDGKLYFSLGERGTPANAQDLGTHHGAIIRLNDDGSVPPDNPFVNRPGAKPEIFTYGNRNPQGMTIDRATGRIWENEHGPQGGDEVNVIRAGTNYGWPVITYGRNYGIGTKIGEGTHKAGMAQPVLQWTPSIAPSGMAFYDGDRFPGWKGNLFVGALKFQLLVRLEVDGEKVVHEERLLEGVLGRIRDVRAGPDGLLYLLTDESDGVIARIEPVNP